MPSAQPSRLTDDLWLAAHDTIAGTPVIGDWPLGVGLAAGLLAELIGDGLLDLRHGELFRTTTEPPDDPALGPLLSTMEAEERTWPPPVPHPADRAARRPPAGHAAHGRAAPIQGETRHRQRGHQLSEWLPYLAYEQRAERLVVERLTRAGLARQVEKRRLFGRATSWYVPHDSVVSGRPASMITSAVQRGLMMPATQLMLAGLFLATGLHQHALSFLSPAEHTELAHRLTDHLDPMSRELLRAADAAVGEAAMR